MSNSAQCLYWIGTISYQSFPTWDAENFFQQTDYVQYIRGQKEQGEGGFIHWQVLVVLNRKQRLSWLTARIPGHWEPSRSRAADEYVWKENTRISGTQFEFGERRFKRNCKTDWDQVWNAASSGRLDDIPSDIRLRYYNNIVRIGGDHLQPTPRVRTCNVYWGKTGTGKSRRAFEEAGIDCYVKGPRTKWWCGYTGQANVVIDEVNIINFSLEEELMWRTSSYGSTVIKSSWRKKEELWHSMQQHSGSPQTSHQNCGTQKLTLTPGTRLGEN